MKAGPASATAPTTSGPTANTPQKTRPEAPQTGKHTTAGTSVGGQHTLSA